jgi:hypothetical protein
MAGCEKLVVIFLIDGARPDIIREQLASGDLPNIEKEVLSGGTFRTATSCLPTTTGPAYLPFLTGCFPGTLNIPGIRWLDKSQMNGSRWNPDRVRSYNGLGSRKFNRDMAIGHPTLHELFDNSFSIHSIITRNLPRKRNLTRLKQPLTYLFAHPTDRWDVVDRTAHRCLMSCLDDDPDFVFTVYPGVDCYAHLRHPWHQDSIDALKFADYSIGAAIDKIKKLGRWDDTLVIITSDHGLTTTGTHLDLTRFLEDRGLKTLSYPFVLTRKPAASVMISGNALAHVYLLGDNKQARLSGRRIKEALGSAWDELMEQEAIDFVAWQEVNGDLQVRSSVGTARIICGSKGFTYRPESGDPLGFGQIDHPLDRDQSLVATFDSQYPDAFVQLEQIFSSPRCGDFIAVSRNGYDLRQAWEWPEHHASHGSLCRDHMTVPLIYNSTGWEERPARTVDLFNTILEWSGRAAVENTDGRTLFGVKTEKSSESRPLRRISEPEETYDIL